MTHFTCFDQPGLPVLSLAGSLQPVHYLAWEPGQCNEYSPRPEGTDCLFITWVLVSSFYLQVPCMAFLKVTCKGTVSYFVTGRIWEKGQGVLLKLSFKLNCMWLIPAGWTIWNFKANIQMQLLVILLCQEMNNLGKC